MNQQVTSIVDRVSPERWTDRARELAPEFARRANDYDEAGQFVYENFEELRDAGFFSAAIPVELGGGGAGYTDLCGVIREIGKHCGSTALTFAMHTHTVGANVFKYLRGDEAAEATLRKIAANPPARRKRSKAVSGSMPASTS